jgi:methylase of polypeptide subunit release factors
MAYHSSENLSSSTRQIQLRTVGDVYLPGRFADAAVSNASLKLFGPKELSQLNRIFNHLRRGGIAVASGPWCEILEILSYLERKKRELASIGAPPAYPGSRVTLQTAAKHQRPRHHQRTGRWYERHYQQVLSRVMVIACGDRLPYVDPAIHIPYLLELLGDPPGADGGVPLLIPVSAIQKIQSDMERSYYISALEGDIIAHSNVLPPLSQDTIELFLEGLQKVEQAASLFGMEILDMGCGCGVLSLLAAKVFADHNVKVVATDILPEAVATTRINIERFIDLNVNRLAACSTVIETTDSGDLFEPVGDRRFDLIIFNAPWVVSHPRSRAEISICDADQNTVRRFLIESPQHLKEQGHIILGYSDHSGLRAVENMEDMIGEAGLRTENVLRRRIQSRRQKRKWETMLVYDLGGKYEDQV